MIRLSDILSGIAAESPLLQFGLANRIFNLSQLSTYLHPFIETRAKKEIKKNTILMALSRLQHQWSKDAPKREAFEIEHIGIQTGLTTYTYPKTNEVHTGIQKVYATMQRKNGYMTISESTNQITIIVESQFSDIAGKFVPGKPLFSHDRIASIGITFAEKQVEYPGMIYVLVQQITLQGINIVEVSSTFTELVLYVDEKDTKYAFDTLYNLFHKV